MANFITPLNFHQRPSSKELAAPDPQTAIRYIQHLDVDAVL
jgi:hypothetical protein